MLAYKCQMRGIRRDALVGRPECSFRVFSRATLHLLIAVLLTGLLASCKPKASQPEIEKLPDLQSILPKAEGGDAEAQAQVGAIYARGEGVKQDYAQAARWYRKAAEQGHAGAQAILGELYEAGQGVTADNAEAAKWYRRAAEQGVSAAQYSLAVLYVTGKGVPKDDAEAVKWYQLAAKQGDSMAQFNLGMRHMNGDGVSRDAVEACKWFELAAAQGVADAAQTRDQLQRTMTREQIQEARRRAEQFVPEKASPPAAKGASNP